MSFDILSSFKMDDNYQVYTACFVSVLLLAYILMIILLYLVVPSITSITPIIYLKEQ